MAEDSKSGLAAHGAVPPLPCNTQHCRVRVYGSAGRDPFPVKLRQRQGKCRVHPPIRAAECAAEDLALPEPRRKIPQQSHLKKLQIRRSEEHTSELQSLAYLVCRLLLEKKKFTAPHIDNDVTRTASHG